MGITFHKDDLNLVVVEFGYGDVLLQALQGYASGAVALLLFRGPPGEIGRDMSELGPEEMPDITTHDTVMLSFSDPKSIDVVIRALERMRNCLESPLPRVEDSIPDSILDETKQALQDEEDRVWLAEIVKRIKSQE